MLVALAVMPQGVEHYANAQDIPTAAYVALAVMPQGVEHSRAGSHW